MNTCGDPQELRQACAAARARGQRVGLVPTMGFLHDGHLSLIERARRDADFVVVSIFVNPTQFGPDEDLERYPRDRDGDVAKCESAGAALVFAPTREAMYPPNSETYVEVEQVSRGLCGERRPGHFRGVCTIVCKLFALTGPCLAVFGEKDYQQLQVIRRMTRDLMLPVQVVSSSTVREADGLAMSSRNAYLDGGARRAAPALYGALSAARARVRSSTNPDGVCASDVLAAARGVLEAEPLVQIEYLELRDAETLALLPSAAAVGADSTVLLVAARLGTTRLIDNVTL